MDLVKKIQVHQANPVKQNKFLLTKSNFQIPYN